MGLILAVCLSSFALRDAAAGQGPELSVGLLEQGVLIPAKRASDGFIIEGSEEKGTRAVEALWRGKARRRLLGMRPVAKLLLNLEGRTSFAAIGGEWRRRFLRKRLYAQAGMGLAIHDGYRFTPDPFEAGLTMADAMKRYDVYLNRTAFGSRVLLNPNLSVGVRVSRKFAVEGVFEHYSHKQLFDRQNPGINLLGIRFVRTIGTQR